MKRFMTKRLYNYSLKCTLSTHRSHFVVVLVVNSSSGSSNEIKLLAQVSSFSPKRIPLCLVRKLHMLFTWKTFLSTFLSCCLHACLNFRTLEPNFSVILGTLCPLIPPEPLNFNLVRLVRKHGERAKLWDVIHCYILSALHCVFHRDLYENVLRSETSWELLI